MTTQELKTRYKLNFTHTVIKLEGSQTEILKQPYTFNESFHLEDELENYPTVSMPLVEFIDILEQRRTILYESNFV